MGLVWKIHVIDLVRFWCRDGRPKTAIRDNGPLQGRILSRRQGRAGEVGTLRTARSATMPCLETQHREHSHGSTRLRRLRPSIFPACPRVVRRPPGCSHCVARSFVPSRAPRRPRRSSCGCVRPRTSSLAMSGRRHREPGRWRFPDRAGRAELVPGRGDAEDDHDLARSGDLPASALPQRRERGIAGAGRREPGPRRRLPDAAGGRARSAADGSLHGPGSGGVLCEDRRHDAVGEHPAAPDPEHARMLGEPRPGDAGQHP